MVLTLFGILINAPVRAEEAHACHARDGLGQPLVLVLVRLIDGRVRLNVAVEVVRDQVVVSMITNSRDHGQEVVGLAECAVLNRLEDLVQIWINGVRAVRVRMTKIFDILREIAE